MRKLSYLHKSFYSYEMGSVKLFQPSDFSNKQMIFIDDAIWKQKTSTYFYKNMFTEYDYYLNM